VSGVKCDQRPIAFLDFDDAVLNHRAPRLAQRGAIRQLLEVDARAADAGGRGLLESCYRLGSQTLCNVRIDGKRVSRTLARSET
jgi:hypothetical protein